ncbi:MAG: DUF4169 family protein [Alphaproteobacteria bacterium]|nr:DUF4169 family protein [Alphaproteobacteria bacterium]MBN9557112.1 DUF4169 family protein [Alphaproteobacteria bacterium]MBN9576798.1 DUF4169 family protein [Alphaproteobacteria bacterium]MBN9591143.1 DUF4169 family protein [Alphaproteobacteria bacterium]
MSEIVNLRRARKEKARAAKAQQAEANRIRHGTPKNLRDLEKAKAEKAAHGIDAHKLDDEK